MSLAFLPTQYCLTSGQSVHVPSLDNIVSLSLTMLADRYFGSFPKVGIVIPNIGQWLLPELQDIAKTLQTTLQLPPDATIGHGSTLEPPSDGLLITFPTGTRPAWTPSTSDPRPMVL